MQRFKSLTSPRLPLRPLIHRDRRKFGGASPRVVLLFYDDFSAEQQMVRLLARRKIPEAILHIG